MKLIFQKTDSHLVNVYLNTDGQKKEFLYVDMIKTLLDKKVLEPSELDGEFTEAEIKSIASMVTCINDVLKDKEKVNVI